jgi:nucleotide-binding universal stress UspA family protein
MAIRNILLATAGGPGGIRAADWLSNHLASEDTTVHVVVLEALGDEYEGLGLAPTFPSVSEAGERWAQQDVNEVIRHTIKHLQGFGEIKTGSIIGGRPVDDLLAAVRQIQPDLLVWGRRGLHRLESLFLGNISSQTASGSPVPVLVIPSPK